MLAARTVAVKPFSGLARPAPARTSVVVAVKPTKAADFRGLSDAEVVQKIGELKTELLSVKILQRTKGNAEMKKGEQMTPKPETIPKGHMNKHLRRQIAQLWTIYRERQVKEGISARESRNLEKRALLAAGSL